MRTGPHDSAPESQEPLSPGRRQPVDRARWLTSCPPSHARLTSGVASCVILLCLMLGLHPGAGAHAILVGSEPADGAILDESPRKVLFRFNAALEHAVTRVYLVNVDNAQRPLRTIDSSIDRVVVDLPRLAPGVYTIVYKVLARDGHVTEGFIRFTIRGR